MKSIALLTLFLFAALSPKAQVLNFDADKKINCVKGTVKVLSEETTVIIPDGNPNQRYLSQQMPEEYKKEGLVVTFSGMTGKIPPNVRMLGTPLKLSKISVTKKEQAKYKLQKRSYVFK